MAQLKATSINGNLTMSGSILPATGKNNTYDLGSDTLKWANVFATTFTGNLTGDVTGNVTGKLTGDVNGNVEGNLKGNVTGDISGNAGSANKINTNAGSATNPVYFSGGVPVACTYSLNKTVPSTAVFTDTWRPIKLDGTDKLGSGTSTNALNIKAGANMTITESAGTFTFAATDTKYGKATSEGLGLVKSSTTGTTANRDYAVEVKSDGTMKVNVPWVDTNATYTTATSDTEGLVKIGYEESERNYAVKLDSNNKMYVNVPWTDNDTHYKAKPTLTRGTTGNGGIVIVDEDNTITTNDTTYLSIVENGSTSGRIQIRGAGATTVSANTTNGVLTISSTNTKYYQATSSALGLVKIGYEESGKNYAVQLNSSGQMYVNVPWTATTVSDLDPATDSTYGVVKTGYSESGKNYAVKLNSSGQMYVNVPWEDNDTTYPEASSSKYGVVKIGYSESGKNYAVKLNSDGQMYVNVPWANTAYALIAPSSSNDDQGKVTILPDDEDNAQTVTLKNLGKGGSPTFGTVTATCFAGSSDYRLKENIHHCDIDFSDIINAIPIYLFNYISDPTKRPVLGTIAQDLRDILPNEVKDALVLGRESETEFLSIANDRLAYLLIGAFKENTVKMRDMEDEIDSLKNENLQLRTELSDIKTLIYNLQYQLDQKSRE